MNALWNCWRICRLGEGRTAEGKVGGMRQLLYQNCTRTLHPGKTQQKVGVIEECKIMNDMKKLNRE